MDRISNRRIGCKMDVHGLICIGLLMGSAGAVVTRSQVGTPQRVSDAWSSFPQTLTCEPDARVYLVAVRYEYDVALCSCLATQEAGCSAPLSPSSLGAISSSCWNSSTCAVAFSAPPVSCQNVTYSPRQANFTFLCVSATPNLTINSVTSTTGMSISAGYRAGSDDVQVCVVETPDCGKVDVALELVIRNDDARSSSFFSVPGHLDSLGQVGVTSALMTLQTPFSVVLHVLSENQLRNAYIAVQADTNLTMTCGLDTTMPPTTFCNLPIQTKTLSRFGQALTAVYSSTGVEVARDWLCVLETEACSLAAPVNVTLYLKNTVEPLDAFFSLNDGLPETDGTRTLLTPASVTLHIRSRVALAYIHAQANSNLSMTCGEKIVLLPTPACTVPIASATPSRKTGQALTAVHFGEKTDHSTWTCVVEAADCAPETRVSLSVHIRTSPGLDQTGTNVSVNGEATGVARLVRSTPVTLILNLAPNSADLVYVFVSASMNITVVCGIDIELNCEHCASSPCPEGLVCSNIPDSFRCSCPDGLNISTDGQTCVVPPTAVSQPHTQTPASVVGPAVGGTIGALAFIAIVIVIIVVVCRYRSRKKKALTKPVHRGHVNTAYEEANYPDEETAPGFPLGQQQATFGLVTSDDAEDYDVLGQVRPAADAKPGVLYGHLGPLGSVGNETGFVYDRAGSKPRQDVIPGVAYLNTTIIGEKKQNGDQNISGSNPGHGVEVVKVSRGNPLDYSAVKIADGYLEVKVNPNYEQYGKVAIDLDDHSSNDKKLQPELQKVDVVNDDGSYMEVRIPGAGRPNVISCGDLGKDLTKPSALQPEVIKLPTKDNDDDSEDDYDDSGAYEDVIINAGLPLRDRKDGDLTKGGANSDKQPPEPKKVEILEDDGGYLEVKVKAETLPPADSKTHLPEPENVSSPAGLSDTLVNSATDSQRAGAPSELGKRPENSEMQLPESEKLGIPIGSSDGLPIGAMDSQGIGVPAKLNASPENSETPLPEPEGAKAHSDLDSLPAHTDTRVPDSATVQTKADDGGYQEVNVASVDLLQGDATGDSRESRADDNIGKLVSAAAAIVDNERKDHTESLRGASEQRGDVAVEVDGIGSAETDSYGSEIDEVTYL